MFAAATTPAWAVDSTALTDKIYQGSGSIDLLKNITPAALASYLTSGGNLMLGVDVNENASGNETSLSMGVALKSVSLVITTTSGTYTFDDLFTNTTATLTAAGTGATGDYYTLFGESGSSQITGSTTGFDLSRFDDVLVINGVVFEGTILSARVDVQFLQTAKNAGENESFFDFSGGFEDFALLNLADAQTLELAASGVADAPSTVTYAVSSVESSPVTASLATTTAPTATPLPVPAAPSPPFLLLALAVGLGIGGYAGVRWRGNGTTGDTTGRARSASHR